MTAIIPSFRVTRARNGEFYETRIIPEGIDATSPSLLALSERHVNLAQERNDATINDVLDVLPEPSGLSVRSFLDDRLPALQENIKRYLLPTVRDYSGTLKCCNWLCMLFAHDDHELPVTFSEFMFVMRYFDACSMHTRHALVELQIAASTVDAITSAFDDFLELAAFRNAQRSDVNRELSRAIERIWEALSDDTCIAGHRMFTRPQMSPLETESFVCDTCAQLSIANNGELVLIRADMTLQLAELIVSRCLSIYSLRVACVQYFNGWYTAFVCLDAT